MADVVPSSRSLPETRPDCSNTLYAVNPLESPPEGHCQVFALCACLTYKTRVCAARNSLQMATKQIPWTIVGLFLICLPAVINAKIYTKCELAKQLTANGISRTYQGHWVCLAIAVSGLDSAKTTTLPNQTASYGIFQINSKEWCRVGYKGGKCNMKCEDLVTDNITNAIKCSKIIQQQNGFNEWVMWQKKCKGKDLPDITNCGAIG
ncbi:lysozyme c-1-like isoform X3 [Anopheles funestus]|uniref:lysozyme c-1-like isoform X3 n=1 Tax=Anopheles funestus TaxID=62324 RepID=UPI0020C6500D|nr:lysozyme c-1-like isoform X3 [Anopheles funestus]